MEKLAWAAGGTPRACWPHPQNCISSLEARPFSRDLCCQQTPTGGAHLQLWMWFGKGSLGAFSTVGVSVRSHLCIWSLAECLAHFILEASA